MSEHGPKLEHHKHSESVPVSHENHARLEHNLNQQAEKDKQKHEALNLEHLLEKAEAQAEASETVIVSEPNTQESESLIGLQQSLKSGAYQHTLLRIQQRLPKQVRIFSKFTHQKTVEAISETSAKTIARPSGLLGGSLCAFLGSLMLLYYSKHYGFTYNYGLFLILFVGGFVGGIIIEVGLWTLTRRKQLE